MAGARRGGEPTGEGVGRVGLVRALQQRSRPCSTAGWSASRRVVGCTAPRREEGCPERARRPGRGARRPARQSQPASLSELTAPRPPASRSAAPVLAVCARASRGRATSPRSIDRGIAHGCLDVVSPNRPSGRVRELVAPRSRAASLGCQRPVGVRGGVGRRSRATRRRGSARSGRFASSGNGAARTAASPQGSEPQTRLLVGVLSPSG